MPMLRRNRRIMHKLIYAFILCCGPSMLMGQSISDDVVEEFVKAMERDISNYRDQMQARKDAEIKDGMQYIGKSYFQMDSTNLRRVIAILTNYAEEDSTLQVHIDMAKIQMETRNVFLKYDSLIYIPYDTDKVCEADSILRGIKGVSEEQKEEITALINKLKEYPNYLSRLMDMFSEEEYRQKIRDDWSDLDLDEIQTNDVGNLFQSFLDNHTQLVQDVCTIPYLEKQMEELKKGIDQMKLYKQMDNGEITGRSLFAYLISFVNDKLMLIHGDNENKTDEGKEESDNE